VKFWNVFGWEEPGQRSHVIPDLIADALKNNEIELMTTGEEKRQFIYVEDCVRNLAKVSNMPLQEYHLTNGKWISILEVAQIIGQQLDVSVTAGSIKGYFNPVNTNESYKEFEFRFSLEEGIQKVIEKAFNAFA
jgi:nucleoside-diphosphate-sugar epimerase